MKQFPNDHAKIEALIKCVKEIYEVIDVAQEGSPRQVAIDQLPALRELNELLFCAGTRLRIDGRS